VAHDLRDVYDDDTLARLDSWRGARAGTAVPAWRRGSAAGLVVTGLALGVREALEPDRRDPVVEEVDVSGLDGSAAVTVLFVPGNPKATIAIVRPWLLLTA
jgi:hypothetical protein